MTCLDLDFERGEDDSGLERLSKREREREREKGAWGGGGLGY